MSSLVRTTGSFYSTAIANGTSANRHGSAGSGSAARSRSSIGSSAAPRIPVFRRSLLPPAMVALLVAGWTVLPGHPLVWTAAALASLALPTLIRGLEALAGPYQQQSWTGFVRAATDDLKTGAARSGLQLTFMAN